MFSTHKLIKLLHISPLGLFCGEQTGGMIHMLTGQFMYDFPLIYIPIKCTQNSSQVFIYMIAPNKIDLPGLTRQATVPEACTGSSSSLRHTFREVVLIDFFCVKHRATCENIHKKRRQPHAGTEARTYNGSCFSGL